MTEKDKDTEESPEDRPLSESAGDEPTAEEAGAPSGPAVKGNDDGDGGGADRETAEPTPAPRPTRHAAGRGALTVAVLVAVLGAAGGGYLYLQMQSLIEAQSRMADQSDLQALADEQQSAVGALNGRVTNLNEALESRLQSLARLENRMADQVAARKELADRVDQLYRRMQSETDDWRIAEAGYLARMAVHRVRFNGDIAGALEALEAADILLSGLGGTGIDRREAIGEAVDRLLAVDRVDMVAINRGLDRVADQLDELPLAAGVTRFEQDTAGGGEDAGANAAEGDWQTRLKRARDRLLEGLGGLVTVSRDRQVEPLPEPESRFLLQQNLLLQIESARLAALRGEADTYRDALQRVDNWVAAYFDSASPAVSAVRERLIELMQLPVAVQAPNIADVLSPLLDGSNQP
mgnify:CR=1 FL=1